MPRVKLSKPKIEREASLEKKSPRGVKGRQSLSPGRSNENGIRSQLQPKDTLSIASRQRLSSSGRSSAQRGQRKHISF